RTRILVTGSQHPSRAASPLRCVNVVGQGGGYVSADTDLTYHHFLEMRLVCRSELADQICERIASAAWTGRKGDGVVFTTAVHKFARIREIGRHPEKRND
ncbi:MAG: P-II family nitrogen regulator, partial [Xanthobacteraceae bacterium]|nr:P-II family nitrogen regulator [Xanthobacteraceae bacterium]